MADKFDEGWMSDAELEAAKRRQPDPNREQKLPLEDQAWTQEELNNFVEHYMKNPNGNLEDFNKKLKEAMNGR